MYNSKSIVLVQSSALLIIFLPFTHSFYRVLYYAVFGMFTDRMDAGEKLAGKLLHYEGQSPMVIAIPRGGVEIGFAVARKLHAPLDVVIVRKLGAPHNMEFGVGAIAEDDVGYIDRNMIEHLQISQSALRLVEAREYRELIRRKQFYRNGESLPLLTNKTVILVDDGLATGASARAALLSIKKHHPKKIIFAVPVCSEDTASAIRLLVDAFVCLEHTEQFEAVGRYYRDFHQMNDEEVMKLLQKSKEKQVSLRFGENGFGHKIVW